MKNSLYHWIVVPDLSPYSSMLKQMEDRVEEVIRGEAPNTIYLVEHEDVYTAGSGYRPTLDSSHCERASASVAIQFKRTDKMDCRVVSKELLAGDAAPIIPTGRGGKLTYHGKGQRVIYPIINLAGEHHKKDIGLYVRTLESCLINTLRELDIDAYIIPNKVGVWVNIEGHDAKIASIGIRIKKWVTYHGIAINISTDLSKFNAIIACGIQDIRHTSLLDLGVKISFDEFDQILKKQFNEINFK
jgi:lipoyl(octanoyl) transferase